MKIFIFHIIFTFLLMSCMGQDDAMSILTKVKTNYEKHSSLSYNIIYKKKYFSKDDTTTIKAFCQLKRDTTDKLFGGMIWFQLTKDSIEKYYDLNNIYLINHPQKKITEYSTEKKRTLGITGNTASGVITTYFLDLKKLSSIINDSTLLLEFVSDSLVDKNHYSISVKYPNEAEISEMTKRFWIRKKDFVIDKISAKAKFQGNYQYDEWNLINIEFDKVSPKDIDNSVKQKNQSYKIEQYVPPTEKDMKLLSNGTQAPVFNGIDFITGKQVSLYDYKGKITILDFSYTSCYPCIKMIPYLVQLKNENKNLNLLAINSKDGDEKRKKKLTEFINTNSMNYPVILTSNKTDSIYNVKAYPTLYLLDKTGKIIYSEIGFSEKGIDTLKSILRTQ